MSRFGPPARRYFESALEARRRRRAYGQGAPRPARRGRFGFWGPVPYYSTRTRRGSEVSVGGCGCCLPIPLIAALGVFGAVRALWSAARGGRS